MFSITNFLLCKCLSRVTVLGIKPLQSKETAMKIGGFYTIIPVRSDNCKGGETETLG
jgi:hypothetical protein